MAMIMDGNGRWAKERGLLRVQGHNAGMEALRGVVEHTHQLGIRYLTVYAFSTENWKRPEEEVSGIFKLLVRYMASELERLHQNNVRINILGDWSAIPEDSRRAVEAALKKTKDNTGLVFNIAINYGGRAEILRAAKILARLSEKGLADLSSFTETDFSRLLYTEDMPDPDLIIRTGGDLRLSNFLTWQSAYSELVVTDCYWPDFTDEEYDQAIDQYLHRDRRFGGIKS